MEIPRQRWPGHVERKKRALAVLAEATNGEETALVTDDGGEIGEETVVEQYGITSD